LRIFRSTESASERLRKFYPNALEGKDAEHSFDEARFFVIGYSTSRMLFAVFGERYGNVIRIISARPPTPEEEVV
jgi:uncharacterized DUF497 family protein